MGCIGNAPAIGPILLPDCTAPAHSRYNRKALKGLKMNDLVLLNRATDWRRLKALVLDSVSSPITKRVYNLGLDEFFAWYEQEPRPGFTKATVSAWRVALEARGLGSVSINVRITAVRKLAVEAADNGLLAPELAAGISRVKGAKSKGVRVGNWLSLRQAQALLNAPDATTKKGLRDRAMLAVLLGLWPPAVRGGGAYVQAHPATR
jgi:site-specific recombinase XerC